MERAAMLGLAWAGLACNILWAWPQVVALVRARQVGDVSPATWALVAVTTTRFVVAGALDPPLWDVLIASVSLFVAAVFVLVLGTRAGWSHGWLWAAIAGCVLAIFAPTRLLDNDWASIVVLVPQLVRLARARSAQSVSLAAWLLYVGQFVFWALPNATQGPVWMRTNLLGPSYLLHVTVTVAVLVLLVLARRRSSASLSLGAPR